MEPENPERIAAELAALRHDLDRRLARLESRLEGLEEMVTALITPQLSRRAGLFTFTRAVPPLPVLPRRPLGGPRGELVFEESLPGAPAPSFEQGLDVPTAANWSRPLLLVTGGITLFFFLLLQLFCAGSTPPPRKAPPSSKVAPAGAAPQAAAPPGVLLVTPANEPESPPATSPTEPKLPGNPPPTGNHP